MSTRPGATMTPSPQLLQMTRRLEQLRSTPENERWPSGELPDDAAFHDARMFLDHLPFPLAALPRVSLADDGEANFAWDSEGVHIDLGFYGTGTYSYYARGSDGQEHFGDEVPEASSLPTDLDALLRS